MTLHINFSPEMESVIRAKVASGFDGNATEVTRRQCRAQRHHQARMVDRSRR